MRPSLFYEALMEAQGLTITPTKPPTGGAPGRKLSYTTRVQFNNNLLVGKAYTLMHHYQPGDEFEIHMSENEIRLVKIADAAEMPAEEAKPSGRKRSKSIEAAVAEQEAGMPMEAPEEWNQEALVS